MTARIVPRALADRLFPVLATIGLIVIGMASTTWWGPAFAGKTAWALPEDLWGTLIAAQRLVHLDLAGLYTQPTGLVTFPGAAVILAPIVVLTDAVGLSLSIPGAQNPQPVVWLVAGPYEIIVSAVALLAADAIASRLGATRPRRALLAGAGAVALWSVSVEWGHPEDPVAVGLFLFGVLALSDARLGRSAWLIGAAIAVQPLVLLALPVVAVVIERRRLPGYAIRAATPAGLLLAAAAWANWHATVRAVTSQPNFPTVNHPTPWTSLAPHLSNGTVAAGPARALTILGACACALVVGRRWRVVLRAARWDAGMLAELLWWIAITLALRSVFEPVMVAYYIWPVLQVALVTATSSWWRLVATSVTTTALTFASQLTWRGPWTWWTPMIAGLCLTLAFARVPATFARVPASRRQPPSMQPSAEEQAGQSLAAGNPPSH
jgi:hypothetical protein